MALQTRTSKHVTFFSCLLASALVATGCSSDGDTDNSTENSEATSSSDASQTEYTTPRTMPEGKGSGEDDGTFPRTVTHFEGETTIEAEPQNVVVISTGQADALVTLGTVPVGSTAGQGAETVPEYLTEAYPEDASALEEVTNVGSRTDPDLEAIANLDPDLILVNQAGADDPAALYSNLTEIAPTVVTQGTGLYWKQDFLLTADAMGKTQEAESWLEQYQSDAAQFGDTVDDDLTVSFLRKNGDRTRIFGVASFSGSIAEDAGLARPDSQDFTDDTSVDLSDEELQQADADWIFYGVQGGDAAELTDLSLWPTLSAVSEDQAVQVDDDTFYLNAGPTAAREALTELENSLGN